VATVAHNETDSLIICLSQIKVERLQPGIRKIISCERDESVTSVFQKLVTNNVLSMPVLNQKGKYYGIVDILDIVRFVTEMFQDVSNTTQVDVEKLFTSDEKFNQTTVAQIMRWPLQKSNPFHPISKGYSLFSAWEVLALSGTRRVPVIDLSGGVVDLVTQSMLIDFLWQNIDKIGKLADRQVKDFESARINFVPKCNRNLKTVNAFQEMVKMGVDHLAIVDDHDKLIDNLSLRDLRGIRPEFHIFYRLWNTIIEFKKKVHEEFPGKTPQNLQYALPTHTFYQVVEMMATNHVHHIFVVDNEKSMKPTRVITQTDVLREVLNK